MFTSQRVAVGHAGRRVRMVRKKLVNEEGGYSARRTGDSDAGASMYSSPPDQHNTDNPREPEQSQEREFEPLLPFPDSDDGQFCGCGGLRPYLLVFLCIVGLITFILNTNFIRQAFDDPNEERWVLVTSVGAVIIQGMELVLVLTRVACNTPVDDPSPCFTFVSAAGRVLFVLGILSGAALIVGFSEGNLGIQTYLAPYIIFRVVFSVSSLFVLLAW